MDQARKLAFVEEERSKINRNFCLSEPLFRSKPDQREEKDWWGVKYRLGGGRVKGGGVERNGGSRRLEK